MFMVRIIFILGALVAVLGIAILIAGFEQGSAEGMISAGSALFSLGVLLAASGFYFQARNLRRAYQQELSKPKKTDRLCTLCNREPALVFCRVHVVRLCADCLEQHDDKSCSYVPAHRAVAAFTRM